VRPVRLVSLVVVLASALAATATAGASESQSPRLIEAGGVRFPDKAFVLTLPTEARLGPREVQVFENGQPVFNPSVIPANAARGRQFGVVLAIDTSNSMKGDAIRNAMVAARAFAARRTPYQQLAVVTFDRRPQVLLPFTTSQLQIENALSGTPDLDQGTAIYDGVDLALRSLRRANISSGSIVLLSDGADVSSYSTREGVIRRARAAHARVFTVGLRNRAFYPVSLELLATQTGGLYTEAASAGALAAIYDRLGYQLANEYLVRYRSLAGPGKETKVTVRVAGFAGTATSSYETPELALNEVPPPAFHRSTYDRALQSPLMMVLIAFLVAAMFAATAIILLQPRGASVRSRVAQFVSLSRPENEQRRDSITERFFEETERSLEGASWWPRLNEELELADIKVPAVQVILGTVIVTLASIWLIGAALDNPLYGVLGLAVPFLVRGFIRAKVRRTRSKFQDQLPDNLEVVAGALRAGHSLVGALSVVVEDAPEPSKSEFQRVIADEQLGVPLEDALGVVVQRMDSKDLDQVAVVAALQRRTGGNSAEVLDRVVQTIRERAEVRRLVKTLTAQGRMARWILTGLPLFVLVVLTIINDDYMSPLYNTGVGRFLLVLAITMVAAGSLAIRKIVDIRI
jgi:Flp pilus assembly protein TadB/Mg-chelatase subunit ChlD